LKRLKVAEEIERGGRTGVFPARFPPASSLRKKFAGPFPLLLMQRGHLSDILVNLPAQFRAEGPWAAKGNVTVTAGYKPQ